MLATAWGLGIANPQSIKRLGHFLTADCKSAGTPSGGKDISGATEKLYIFYTILYCCGKGAPAGDINSAEAQHTRAQTHVIFFRSYPEGESGALGMCIYYVAKLYFLCGIPPIPSICWQQPGGWGLQIMEAMISEQHHDLHVPFLIRPKVTGRIDYRQLFHNQQEVLH